MLKVISRSTFDLQTVLDTLVESAARLCDADHAWLFRRDGDSYRWSASYGHSRNEHARIKDYFLIHNILPTRTSLVGRTALAGKPTHIVDVLADPEYKMAEAQKLGNYRTAFGVPLLREGETIGVIGLLRSEVRPFTDKQIELAITFADQAVIAIENARLLNELRQRTDDLTESLEQQTATSEVLKVISSSPGDLQPVFNAMLENAVRICDAKFGVLHRCDNERINTVALFGAPPALAAYIEAQSPRVPPPGTPLYRMMQTKDVVRIADDLLEPVVSPPAKFAGARSLIAVPMLKEDDADRRHRHLPPGGPALHRQTS